MQPVRSGAVPKQKFTVVDLPPELTSPLSVAELEVTPEAGEVETSGAEVVVKVATPP